MSLRQRYYYTTASLFEQSIDVYEPSLGSDDTQHSSESKPVVLLVVGSGWMGHQPFPYLLTSWWNSSGPKSVAQSLNTTCICIRHRGSYFKSFFIDGFMVILLLTLLIGYSYCYSSEKCNNPSLFDVQSDLVVFTVILAFMWFLWHWLAKGAATIKDMVEDVENAVTFVKENSDLILGKKVGSNETRKMVFGGYSSGGHVAATMLSQNPQKWKEEFHCILYISGVLAVRAGSIASLESKPRFLIDFVMRTVWGEQRTSIPSPIESRDVVPLPHLLVACKNEVFGLPILDIFLCSELYHEKLNQLRIPVLLRHVHSDHWFVLSSSTLRLALKEEMPKLLGYSKAKKGSDDTGGIFDLPPLRTILSSTSSSGNDSDEHTTRK